MTFKTFLDKSLVTDQGKQKERENLLTCRVLWEAHGTVTVAYIRALSPQTRRDREDTCEINQFCSYLEGIFLNPNHTHL